MEEIMATILPTVVSPGLSPDEVRARTKISEGFFSVFSNHVRIGASATEIRIFFGETYPTATGEVKVTENFSVVLTPVLAKSMIALLANTIQRAEALYGTIPVTQAVKKEETPQVETPDKAKKN
jgi:hypothetical protein